MHKFGNDNENGDDITMMTSILAQDPFVFINEFTFEVCQKGSRCERLPNDNDKDDAMPDRNIPPPDINMDGSRNVTMDVIG